MKRIFLDASCWVAAALGARLSQPLPGVVNRVLDAALPLLPGSKLISVGGRTPAELLVGLAAWIPHGNPYWVRALSNCYLGNPLVPGHPAGPGSVPPDGG